ncbi:MAG: 4-hydroxythreonine-4-phosphate dehydrogenase PdxA [Candidatus Omnitrophica bacterium]|nr:4-hydroxythreonine-4-phosphate dehydrogenase PdxA [Candidatus Omnitrophota bacterium]
MAKLRVGITIGDPSGIGPEVTRKAMRKIKGLADFLVIGDARVWNKVTGVEFLDLANIDKRHFQFGKITAEYGRASIQYLDKALDLIENKRIDCLVTCPISKEAINKAGFNFSGHTEYFAGRCKADNPVMMLLNDRLRFSLVTRHIPLKSVSDEIESGGLKRTILLSHKALKDWFGVSAPRFIVAGVNPHASDNGVIGKEEVRTIIPLLKGLKRQGIFIDGPIGADTAIAAAAHKKYDCVIAMYHDQALIPLKLLGNASGVNLTIGLPFIRTSPLHGTAFDIAGKNLASEDSLISAIKLAIKCTLNQKKA